MCQILLENVHKKVEIIKKGIFFLNYTVIFNVRERMFKQKKKKKQIC